MPRYATASSLLSDTYCFVAPDRENEVESCMRALAEHPRADEIFCTAGDPVAQEDFWGQGHEWGRPYVVKDGVLHVPVRGVLLHDFTRQIGRWATGYYYIQKAVERGVADPNVRGIALVCHSPGGMVAGCFELVDRLYAMRSKKPIASFAHEYAYSAAYAVASAGRTITVSRTGGVGSIGVVRTHVDVSKALESEGVKITFIHAGKYKVEGNSYEPLSEHARERMQTEIDEMYSVFVSTVARNRSMEERAVRKTEALTFSATESLDQGLADKVGPFDDAIADFAALLDVESGEDEMTEKSKDGADDQAAAVAQAAQQGAASGAKAERERIAGIKALDEAKTRPTAAESVAMNTEMSVEAAKAFLATLPEEPKPEATAPTPAPTNSGDGSFTSVMEAQNSDPAGAGSGDELTDERSKDAATSARILTSFFGSSKSATTH